MLCQIVEGAAKTIGVDAPIIVHLAVDEQHRHLFGILCGELLIHPNIVFGVLHGDVPGNPTMLRLKLPQHRLHHKTSIVAKVATRLADEVDLDSVQHENILSAP